MCGGLNRTVLHFFPCAGNVTAPYATHCKLTIFGSAAGMKTAVLEGARLSQPDGLRLEDAFPALRDVAPAVVGLTIEIGTLQARVDLSSSMSVIEIQSGPYSTRFWPALVEEDDALAESLKNEAAKSANRPTSSLSPSESITKRGLWIKDAFMNSSLLLINAAETAIAPRVVARVNGAQPEATINVPPVGGQSVSEISSDSAFPAPPPIECSWGLARMGSVAVTLPPGGSAGCYAIYRDAGTRRVTSVCAI